MGHFVYTCYILCQSLHLTEVFWRECSLNCLEWYNMLAKMIESDAHVNKIICDYC